MLVATALDSPIPALPAAEALTGAVPMHPVRRPVVGPRRLHPRSPGFLLHWRQRMVYWAWNCPRWQVVVELKRPSRRVVVAAPMHYLKDYPQALDSSLLANPAVAPEIANLLRQGLCLWPPSFYLGCGRAKWLQQK